MTRTIAAAADGDISPTFAMASGLEAVRQRAVQRLRFTLGEWFLDGQEGIPYFDGVFADRGSPELAARLVAAEVLAIADVTAVEVARSELDPATRRLGLELRVETIHGPTTIRSEV